MTSAAIKPIRADRAGLGVDVYGTDSEIRQIANIIGRPWNKEREGLRAEVCLGFYPDQVEASINKLNQHGYAVQIRG